MRFYITGVRGQLGSALARRIRAEDRAGGDLPELSIEDEAGVRTAVASARPDVLVHCAAMTDVDGCARDPERAHRINAVGARIAAAAAAECGASLVYVSTNEVFDGTKGEPYTETDSPNPINAYGRSKLEGEILAAEANERCWIVRTSWLYGAGGRNFVHRVRALADENGSLRVVTDEFSSPTWVEDLADAMLRLIAAAPHGIYHVAASGGCSRYTFARTVLDLTGRGHVPIEPITRSQWPRPSTPPPFTTLDVSRAAALGVAMRPWRDALEEFFRSER